MKKKKSMIIEIIMVEEEEEEEDMGMVTMIIIEDLEKIERMMDMIMVIKRIAIKETIRKES